MSFEVYRAHKNDKNRPKHYTVIKENQHGKFRFKYFNNIAALHKFCAEHDNDNTNMISSKMGRDKFAGQPYDEWLETCKTLKGLEGDVARVNEIVNEISEYQPSGRNYKRQRVNASHGVSINTQKALRGQFNKCWRGFRRETSMNGYGVITILVNVSHASQVKKEAIFWCTAAVIALADYLESKGIQVEVFTVHPSRDCYEYVPDHSFVMTRIKDAGQAWNIHQAVLTAQSEYLRRTHFRVEELIAGSEMKYGYGFPMELTDDLVKPFCEHMNIEGKPILGPSTRGFYGEFDRQAAIDWIQRTVKAVDNNE